MGVIDFQLLGPEFFIRKINGENYEHCLRLALSELIIEIPEETGNNIFFQHDGFLANNSVNVLQFLNKN